MNPHLHRRWPSRLARLARLAVALAAVAALGMLAWSKLAVAPSAAVAGPPVPGTLLGSSKLEVDQARTALAGLAVVTDRQQVPEYRRAAFGDAWTDTDGNGCNQRDDVLLRDVLRSASFTVGRQGGCDHDVLSGTWIDPYSGTVITLTDAKQPRQAESVQIDHIVALSVAWRYGAHNWTPELRVRFANDLRDLVASGAGSNQSKGGSDAAQWRPVHAAQCGYAVRYITVKAAYALPTDKAERRALAAMLATCP